VPEVVVEVVEVLAVDEVSVIVPEGIAEVEVAPEVADAEVPVVSVPVVIVDAVSVELIVPVVPVAAVSVDIVDDEVALESVEAVSLLTFSSFLQPTAKMATANSATRVR